MTRKQWDLLNQTVASAQTMLRSRIAEYEAKGHDAAMYQAWLDEADEARTELSRLGSAIPYEVWFAKEAA
jgi:hypothetical protein